MPPQKPLLIAIDDELDMAKLAADVAEMVGFEVRYVESVPGLLQLSEQRQPDVIVTDICMPDTDGIELVHLLASRGSRAGLVLISGYEGRYLPVTEMIAKERHLECLGKLQKPYRLEELQALLKEAHAWCLARVPASA